ncbi:hypothetical protein TNCV_2506231 [Trichonephila clavipes]|uniref:Uncharacterized protein n=1 Tax=Trichonephila clavipes TaxID=2585209 RepID=A0A8X7BK95_TRICX|nr:hypothetical protein TNCV_2506231 [Trichonephila clavipes]
MYVASTLPPHSESPHSFDHSPRLVHYPPDDYNCCDFNRLNMVCESMFFVDLSSPMLPTITFLNLSDEFGNTLYMYGLREGGFSLHDFAERLDWNVSTVHYCSEQWSKNGTASRRTGTEWPRSITEMKNRRIRHTTVVHRTASVVEI